MRIEVHTIKMFGIIAEKTGTHVLSAPHMDDTDQFTAWLFERYPQLEGVRFTLAIDKQLIHSNTVLNERAEIALLPPYSGG